MTRFDQPGLGSLLLLPNESSSSKTSSAPQCSFWAGAGLVQMLLCAPVLSCPRQTKRPPPGWAPLSALQDSQGCCAPFPNPTLPAWESRGVQVLTDFVPALCICMLLSHSQGRAAERFPAPPAQERGLIGSFFLTRAGHVVHSRWIQQLHWLVSARKPIWKEGGGKKIYKITSTLWVAELFLAIPSRKNNQ